MKKEYDFSKMKVRKNPYVSSHKKPVTMRLGEDVIEYFKSMSSDTGVPYQSLINLYLQDCVEHQREIDINWQVKSYSGKLGNDALKYQENEVKSKNAEAEK